MDKARTLTVDDLTDIMNGACILGSGGGGPLAVATELVSDLQKLGPVRLVDPREVPADLLLAVSAIDGSPDAALSGPFPYQVATNAFEALNALQRPASGKDLAAVVGVEAGAGNSLIPMIVAAMKGIPVVDAAGARRAVPKLNMCTFAVAADLPVSPIAVSDGVSQVALYVADAGAAELGVRGTVDSGLFPEFAGLALWTMSGADMRRASIPGVISYAQGLGKAVREARVAGANPVVAAIDYLDGYLLFQGEGLTAKETTSGGFDYGVVTLQTDDKSATCTIFNQNENLIAWSSASSRPLAMAPDLICYLTTDGHPLSNADLGGLSADREVAIIGAPAGPQLRNPSIVAAFMQLIQSVGYYGPYAPIETLR